MPDCACGCGLPTLSKRTYTGRKPPFYRRGHVSRVKQTITPKRREAARAHMQAYNADCVDPGRLLIRVEQRWGTLNAGAEAMGISPSTLYKAKERGRMRRKKAVELFFRLWEMTDPTEYEKSLARRERERLERRAYRRRRREHMRPAHLLGWDLETQRWVERAKCATHPDPDLWHPEPPIQADRVKEAIAVCRTCPVRRECLEWAMAHPRQAGKAIWGGLAEWDRR